ncbi:helix-turn-helix domain-containing protein [Starkeya sp. ORNL1]|uniref:helix-turn-helix domain-containing protein n=1 Tax=Starkeya sp. ORNL1 TaxID=2709380 RepID=UPI0014648ED6|nr:helix-turn-helix domain-containing protein [Starkeya sp. ORNL1]QJP14816.1 helix-turn-helix domain-containing protein [Starkeya sp. ORNL1]
MQVYVKLPILLSAYCRSLYAPLESYERARMRSAIQRCEAQMQISYTISEASKATGIGRTTLFEAMKSGELPARKLGVKNLILACDLEAYIKSRPTRLPSRNEAR